MDKSDEELIVEYLGGRRGAFDELTLRHLDGVYSFVRRFVGNEQEAEDIVQDAFVKAWNNLKKYNPKSSKFKTWMLRIARNTAIDFLRKKKHVPFSQFESEGVNVLTETVADDEESPEESLARAGDSREITAALERLSPKHREVLLLYYTNDSTFEEIGAVLGESPNTIKSRHRRALRALAGEVKIPPEKGTKRNNRNV
jgi:RNA polymerase sigma factor (sigma-70 family)